MKLARFISLERNWNVDRESQANTMRRIFEDETSVALVYFPEGTTMCRDPNWDNLGKSHRFAAKNALKPMNNVLIPRTTGMQYLLSTFKDSFNGVLDLTVAYGGTTKGQDPDQIYSFTSWAMDGIVPPEIQVHCRFFPIEEIPYENPEEFSSWLYERFYEKDDLMEYFYEHGHFPGQNIKTFPVSTVKDMLYLLAVFIMPLFAICWLLVYFVTKII